MWILFDGIRSRKMGMTIEEIKAKLDKSNLDSDTLVELTRYLERCQELEQMKNDMMYDIYMEGVNMGGEYQGCWVRFKDIENIVKRYFS